MIEVLIHVVLIAITFIAGIGVGAHNVPSVTKAIAAIKAAEDNAKTTLARITSHKAS